MTGLLRACCILRVGGTIDDPHLDRAARRLLPVLEDVAAGRHTAAGATTATSTAAEVLARAAQWRADQAAEAGAIRPEVAPSLDRNGGR